MQVAFNGGEVGTELVNGSVYFRARDLISTAGIPINTMPYKDIRKRADIEYKKGIGPIGCRQPPAFYVKLSDAFELLDAVHANTRPETMMLMSEIAEQFSNQLE